MATSIGVKMQMDGAAQFKADLQQITQKSKELAAEMKAAASGEADFAKRQQILGAQIENAGAKIDKLNQKYSQQEKQLEQTKAELEEAKRAYGEDSQEAQKLTLAVTKQETALSKTKTEINKATDELNKLSAESGDTSKDMKELEGSTKNAGEGFSVFKGIVADLAASAIKAAAAGIKQLGAAFVDLVKSSIEGYGQMEQLEGGVQKLFGEDAPAVVAKANDAYKTAGMSAADYMETVTGVSASLISSLGGDTAKAAEMADMMISDMADNANVFGSSMEDVQAVYTSLSKGQFQTLDNLKLGYAGTKTGMQELIADAEKLDSSFVAQRDSAGNLTMEYSDMVQAIHIVQDNMGITGTTMNEAADTIEGSINSMKASWQNFVAGLGDSNADISQLTGNLIQSATNVAKNITPVIQNIVKALPQVVKEISKNLPQLMDLGMEIVETIGGSIVDNIPILASSIGQLLPQLIQMFVKLVEGIAQNFSAIITPLLEALPQIVDAIVGALPEIITAILNALPDIIRSFIHAIPQIIDAILEALPDIILAIIEALPQIVIAIIEELPNMAVQIAKAIITNFPKIVVAIAQGLWSILSQIGTWFGSLFQSLGQWLGEILKDVWEFVKKIPSKIAEGFKGIWEAGKNLVKGLWNGINDAVGWVLDKIKGFGKKILDGIKGIFGIKSPSREMAWVGQMLDEGLAKGIDKYSGLAIGEAFNVADGISGAMGALSAPNITAGATALGASGRIANNSVTMNIYGADGQNINDLADVVIDKLQRTIIGSEAVYA